MIYAALKNSADFSLIEWNNLHSLSTSNCQPSKVLSDTTASVFLDFLIVYQLFAV